MRRRSVWAAALVLTLALAGCGAPAAESPSPQPSTPIETATPTPKPINDPYVYTDWSKLEDDAPRPTVYTRWYGDFTDHLIPSENYGPLIPFDGGAIADEWGGEYGTYALQGLMTLDGKVVVDPVYSAVTRLSSGGAWDYGEAPDTYYGAYLLSRYVGDGNDNELFGGYRDVVSALCAADGSWVTPEYHFSYSSQVYGEGVQNGAIFALRDDNALVLLDVSTGEELFTLTLDGYTETQMDFVLGDVFYGDGRITLQDRLVEWNSEAGHTVRCWDLNGAEIPLPADVDAVYGFSEGLCPARRAGGGYAWGYLGLDGAWAIPPQFSHTRAFEGGVALLGGHAHTLIDKQGNILYEAPVYDHCSQTGDYWYFTGYSGDAGLVLDREGNEVASPLLFGGYVDALDHGWAVMTNADGSHTLGRGTDSWAVPKEWGYIRETTEDTVFFDSWEEYSPEDNRPRWAVWRPETEERPTVFMGGFGGLLTDPVTGTRYCRIYHSDGIYSLCTPEGKVLFDGLQGWPNLYGGRCLTTRDDNGRRTVELRDENGNVLFYRQWENPFD